jgi:signal transduction histidine kinase
MRIANQFSLSLFTLSIVVFGSYGAFHLHTERNDLRAAVKRETRLLTYSLQVAVENALRDQQIEDVERLLGQMERIEPSVHIRIYFRDGRLIRSDAEPLAAALDEALGRAAQSGRSRLWFYPEADPDSIALSLPFGVAGTATRGHLAVVRSLEEMRRDLRATERDILVSVVSFVVSTYLLALVLGRVYIRRPLERLGTAMRQFRGGDSPGELPTDRHDELAMVAEEFNRMVADLSEARRRLDVETERGRQMQRILQEADKLIAIGQLSAGLAHEIGSPLQILNGRARALGECADRPQEVRRQAEILVAQTDRIARIVQQLLEFTRRRPPVLARTDLTATVREVLDLLQHEARRRQCDFRFQCADPPPTAILNRDGIQQIVLNLVGNALAATPGGGTVTVGLSAAAMTTPTGGAPALRLTVEDNGRGISPDHLPHLFEPFFTTRADRGGIGLGLAVVKTIVTEHGGTIAAESEVGAGCCFTVLLPVAGPASLKEAV